MDGNNNTVNTSQPMLMDDVPMNHFHKKMTALTWGAHFVDGYSIGSISMALTVMAAQTNMSPVWQGLIGSSALIGLFFGSSIMGKVADIYGRQKIFTLNFIIITLASLLQLFVSGAPSLFILRVIIGFFLGSDYTVCFTLLSEIAPRKQRGDLLGFLSAIWTIGYCLSTVIGFVIEKYYPSAWNWVLASTFVPAIIMLIARLGTPESPRWLVKVGRLEEARAIVDKYIGKGVIIEEAPPEKEVGYRLLFSKKYRKQTWFGALFFVCNVIPYFAVYTFLPTILQNLGIKASFTTDLALNILLVVGGFVGLWCTMKLTRRGFSIGGFLICGAALLAVSVIPVSLTPVIIASFVVFTVAISALSNLSGVFPPEVLPTEVRSSGVGFAVAMSRVGSAAATFMLPIMMSGIGMRFSLLILDAVLFIGALVCWAWAPETKGLSLTSAVTEGVERDAK